jgi:tetratricopeptide (TPR) repeat protein
MSHGARPRFDPHTLGDLAGDKVLARGQAYFRDGSVEILSLERSRVLARVAGTRDYRTVLTGQGTAIGGECSCPAFERDGFCKHMVAVALAVNAAPGSGAAEGAGTITQIRDYLKDKDVDALVKMIVDLAEEDPALYRKLEIAAAARETDGKVLEKRLRKAIDSATRTRGFIDYGQAPSWAADVDAVLDALAELAPGPHAPVVIGLADVAASRVECALEDIDDSDGFCSELIERAQLIHLEACRAAKPEPVALARDLFLHETEDELDAFYGAAGQYADVLGEKGLAEYRRLAIEAWQKLPQRGGARRDRGDFDFARVRLSSILDFFAERDGDVDMRIALRAKDLSSPWDYFQLAEFCRAQGRDDEALRHAEEGLWVFEDERPDERLVSCAVDLLLRADRSADAEAHLWRAFEKAPSLDLYGRLRDLGGKVAAKRARGLLQEQLAGDPSRRWPSPADLLVSIMMKEKMIEAAWAAVDEYGASRNVMEVLAKASERTHPQKALTVYAERVEYLAKTGGNPAYEAAAALIVRMASLRCAADQAAYVSGLKERHGRKRNFMKLLG